MWEVGKLPWLSRGTCIKEVKEPFIFCLWKERKHFSPVRVWHWTGAVIDCASVHLKESPLCGACAQDCCGQSLGPRKRKRGCCAGASLGRRSYLCIAKRDFCCLLPDPTCGRMDTGCGRRPPVENFLSCFYANNIQAPPVACGRNLGGTLRRGNVLRARAFLTVALLSRLCDINRESRRVSKGIFHFI